VARAREAALPAAGTAAAGAAAAGRRGREVNAHTANAVRVERFAKTTLWMAAGFTIGILVIIIGFIIFGGLVSVSIHEYQVIGKGRQEVVLGMSESERVAFIVNPAVTDIRENRKIRFVNSADVKRMFRGGVSNWSEIGGYDLPIRPVQFAADSDITRSFKTLVFGEEDREKPFVGAHTVHDTRELELYLSSKEGTVAYVYYTDVAGSEDWQIMPVMLQEVRPNLTVPFLLETPRKAGRVGGISTIIANTFFMILLVLFFATPIGVCVAIFLTEYAKQGVIVRIIRFATETLAGIPSIIFGLFGFIFFVTLLKLNVGLLSGTLTLTIMVLPTMIRTAEEAIKAVPDSYREGSLALGATKWQTITGVVVPAAAPGILTGIILSIGRAVGETAAVIFTLGSNYKLVDSLTSSARVLSVHLYMLVKEGISFERAFATATVLMVVVPAVNFTTARLISRMRKTGEQL